MDDRDDRPAPLACPLCGAPLAEAGGSARCPAGHCFDYARSGYLNLAGGGRGGGRVGDTAEMVRAREQLLATGHLAPIARAVANHATAPGTVDDLCNPAGYKGQEGGSAVVVEVGSGTGYYLAALAAGLGRGLGCAVGVDLSKAAADRAARAHPGLRFVVADVEAGIPRLDASADLALSVFAPRPAAELGRVVRPGGALLVALAAPDHLRGLRERLGLLDVPADKLERLRGRLAPWFEPAGEEEVAYEVSLSAAEARWLVLMGPNARHAAADLAAIEDPHPDRVAVTVAGFRRRG